MRAVLLDRDGVLNVERPDYVKSWKEFQWLPRAREALALLTKKGWPLFIVTNQSGINRGLMTEENLLEIHRNMENDLAEYEVKLDGIYHCPHRPDENCECRKPAKKLFERIIQKTQLDADTSWMVGDKVTDLIPALSCGLNTILLNNSGGRNHAEQLKIQSVQPDLYAAVEYILNNTK